MSDDIEIIDAENEQEFLEAIEKSLGDGPDISEENENADGETVLQSLDGEIEDSIFVEKEKIIYKLSDFEGPLDLLLALIKEAKISIDEIFVSDVTKQYIEIIKETPKEEFDFEYAGEFITMAAELIYIKSVRTLPQVEVENEEDDVELQKRNLILKLKEYQLMQEQAEKLKDMETINVFYREPQYNEKDCRVAITNFSLPKLIDAFANVLIKMDRLKQEETPKTVMREKFSVHDQMNTIREKLKVGEKVSFYSMFESWYDKADIVTTFLAILELIKYQKITAEQDEETMDIKILAVEGENDTPIIFEEGDDGEYK